MSLAAIWILVTASCFNLFVDCFTLYNVTALRRYLFETKQYDKISRPMMDQSLPTRVVIKFNIYTIYDIEEVTQTLKVSGSLHMEWLDEALQWDPADFGGIQVGVYPQDHVWKPGVALKNSVENYESVGDPTLHVVVLQNGSVTWDPYEIFTSRCVFDITYFPFDRQTCEITFVTWGYRSSEILLTGPASGEAANVDDLITHPVWNLDHVTYSTFEKPRPMITYYLSLERKPRYIISSIILPLIVLIILNVCVFILPGNSGERVSYAITVFLSFVVFSTVVHETLPVNSENVCVLSVYITVEVFQSAAITILAILLIRLERRTDPVPGWLSALVCSPKSKQSKVVAKTAYDYDTIRKRSTADSIQMMNVRGIDDNGNATLRRELSAGEDRNNVHWLAVVHRLDGVLFVLFFSVNVLFTTICFMVIVA